MANVKSSTKKRSQGKADEAISPWLSFWLVLAAVWLQAVVILFILVRVSHFQTPVIYWVDKMIDSLTESR
jgi:hypothetical protein